MREGLENDAAEALVALELMLPLSQGIGTLKLRLKRCHNPHSKLSQKLEDRISDLSKRLSTETEKIREVLLEVSGDIEEES